MKATTSILMTALCLIAVTAYADNASSSNILGNYKCQRIEGSNTNSYPVSITKTGDTYTIEWTDSAGNPLMYGTGVIHPNLPNVLSSSFWNISNTDMLGIEIFNIKSDGSLQADWVTQSGKTSGSETCTKG